MFLVTSIWSSKNQELYLQANNEYLQRNFDKALILYDQIASKGPAVWHNMGNSSYQLGNYLDALIYYQRAKKGAMLSTLQELEKVIEQAQQQLQVIQQKSWFKKVSESFSQLAGLLPLLPLQLLCLLVAFLLAWAVFRYIKTRKYNVIIIVLISLIISLILLFIKNRAYTVQNGILVQEATIFVGPQKTFHSLGSITPGYFVSIKKIHNNWYKIKANNLSGWVPADTITLL